MASGANSPAEVRNRMSVPVIESTVISGRAEMRINGITFPGRFRFTHDPGQGYHRQQMRESTRKQGWARLEGRRLALGQNEDGS
jgi:hypothetical protein